MDRTASSFFRDLSVGTRLSALIILGVISIAVVAGAFFVADRRTEAALARHAEYSEIVHLASEMETGLARLRRYVAAFQLNGDAASADGYAAQSARLLAVLQSLGRLPGTAPVRNAIDTLRDGISEHAAEFKKVANLGSSGPAARADVLWEATEEAAEKVEAELAAPGREVLAARLLGLERLARRFLAGESKLLVEMVRIRHQSFDPSLAGSALPDTEKAAVSSAMDAYFAAVVSEAEWRNNRRATRARLTEILDYLQPSRDALIAFRKEAEATMAEAGHERARARWVAFIAAGSGAAAILFLGTLLVVAISRPMNSLAAAARQIVDGHREAFIPISNATDEIGDISRALRVVRDSLDEADIRQRMRGQREKSISLRGQAIQRALAEEIEQLIDRAATAVSVAAADLRQLADEAAAAAVETGRHAGEINAASSTTTASLRELATVASSLHVSVGELQRRLSDASAAGRPAGNGGAGAELSRVGGLALRARMMALNGVIGASRGGDEEAGLAFEDIAAEAQALVLKIAEAGARLAEGPTPPPFGDVPETVGRHGAAARDILRNAEGAVGGALSLSNAISRITRTAAESGRVAEAIRNVAETAAQQSERLRGDVDGILARVREQR